MKQETGRKTFGTQSLDKHLNTLLQPLFSGSKKEFIFLNNLSKNWHKIVGKKYAALCHPKSCSFPRDFAAKSKKTPRSGAKLTIAVHNPATGFFLENNSDLILERLAVFCGFKMITKVIIVQDPREIADVAEKEIKLSDEESSKLDKNLTNVKDSELSAVLKKIGATVLKEKTEKK